MYCPRCGRELVAGTPACGSCGLPLESVHRLLRAEAGGDGANRGLLRRAAERGGLVALGFVLAILWIIRFAVGTVEGEAFTWFLVVLSFLSFVLIAFHAGLARYRRSIERTAGSVPSSTA